MDLHDNFSQVVKPITIHIVLTLALSHGWPLRQLDVNNAFLHGTLAEDVFMQQPSGFIDRNHPNFMCKLRKAIYGLKQTPWAWYNELKGSCFLLALFSQPMTPHYLSIIRRLSHYISWYMLMI